MLYHVNQQFWDFQKAGVNLLLAMRTKASKILFYSVQISFFLLDCCFYSEISWDTKRKRMYCPDTLHENIKFPRYNIWELSYVVYDVRQQKFSASLRYPMQTFTFQPGNKQYSSLQSTLLWEFLNHLLNHSTYLNPVCLRAGASELFSTVDYLFCASSI